TSCQVNNPIDDRYDKQTAVDGKYYFNLKAANHQVIGTSQMYGTTQARDTGIASVKTNGPTKDVRDNT
ncbi:MAG: YegP family protein, partial [Paucibacter sp.]|nr:YegP family protein [Roseateles sp.]